MGPDAARCPEPKKSTRLAAALTARNMMALGTQQDPSGGPGLTTPASAAAPTIPAGSSTDRPTARPAAAVVAPAVAKPLARDALHEYGRSCDGALAHQAGQ